MKANKFSFQPISFLIWVSVSALGGWGLSHWNGMNFWGACAIVGGAMFINGVIADIEDNAPGGFNNPLPPEKTKPSNKESGNSDQVS